MAGIQPCLLSDTGRVTMLAHEPRLWPHSRTMLGDQFKLSIVIKTRCTLFDFAVGNEGVHSPSVSVALVLVRVIDKEEQIRRCSVRCLRSCQTAPPQPSMFLPTTVDAYSGVAAVRYSRRPPWPSITPITHRFVTERELILRDVASRRQHVSSKSGEPQSRMWDCVTGLDSAN